MKKTFHFLGALFLILPSMAVEPSVEQDAIVLKQDGANRRLTVDYTLTGGPAVITADIQTNIVGTADWASIGVANYPSLGGDVNQVVQPGVRRISWQPEKDWPDRQLTNAVRAVVTAWALDKTPDYLVVDLADRSRHFYVSAEAVPGGVTNDLYKTTRILMRRVSARGVTWRMGSSLADQDRVESDNRELPHYVALSADYYLGVYEVTEAQWCGGAWRGGVRTSLLPAVSMSYNALRGTAKTWPADGHALDGALGTLRTLTGVPFDLPTEAQWEYACRAGVTTQCYDGRATRQEVGNLGWHMENAGSRRPVGGRLPNKWGFYDLYGNASELCLDWFDADSYDQDATMVDPVGAVGGAARVKRGGCFAQRPAACRSAYRDSDGAGYAADNQGFRLCCGANVAAFDGGDVDAAFRSPRNLSFSYTLADAAAIVTVDIQTNIAGSAEWASIGAAHTKSVMGEVNKVVAPRAEPYRVVWCPDLDWPGQHADAGSVRAVFTFHDLAEPPDYMSVDLGAKGGCRRFYADVEAVHGDLSDTHHPCRHSRLLMRRIPAAGATFRMGAVRHDPNRAASEAARLVTLSEDFFMAVFETTRGQFSNGAWDQLENDSPVANLSWCDLRGEHVDWPADGHEVGAGSPFERLRNRTGIPSFDLPTEAQWEFACRAGVTAPFSNGTETSAGDLAWTRENSGIVAHDVGRKAPNPWGLYDMHGNVVEWCLDWYAPDYDPSDVVDPAGPSRGTARSKRGGCYTTAPVRCRSSDRDSDAPGLRFVNCGFRLVCGANLNDYR